jgi:hypothetical protein
MCKDLEIIQAQIQTIQAQIQIIQATVDILTRRRKEWLAEARKALNTQHAEEKTYGKRHEIEHAKLEEEYQAAYTACDSAQTQTERSLLNEIRHQKYEKWQGSILFDKMYSEKVIADFLNEKRWNLIKMDEEVESAQAQLIEAQAQLIEAQGELIAKQCQYSL